jgi:hypothetical protein
MLRLGVVDVETTFQKDDKGKTDPSPFNPKNYLVSVGISTGSLRYNGNLPPYLFYNYYCIEHNRKKPTPMFAKKIQDKLDSIDLIIGHHLKFDREWLEECGWTVPSMQWDTMLAEYTVAAGMKVPLSLEDSCERRNTLYKKQVEKVKEYLDKGWGFERIPWNTVKYYGISDLRSTYDLFKKQIELLGITDVRKFLSTPYSDLKDGKLILSGAFRDGEKRNAHKQKGIR